MTTLTRLLRTVFGVKPAFLMPCFCGGEGMVTRKGVAADWNETILSYDSFR